MSAKSYEWADEPAGVKWFPNSAPYWVSIIVSIDVQHLAIATLGW